MKPAEITVHVTISIQVLGDKCQPPRSRKNGGAPSPHNRQNGGAPLLIKIGEAAKYLGVSRPTLWRMTRDGLLKQVEVRPGSFRIRRQDLEKFAASGVCSPTAPVELNNQGE